MERLKYISLHVYVRSVVRSVQVSRRQEVADRSPDYVPLWVTVKLAHGYNFDNWLDWPHCQDNWPEQFDKVMCRVYVCVSVCPCVCVLSANIHNDDNVGG